MPSKPTPRRKNVSPSGDPEQTGPTGESLDQVRDILFGGQMRAVESRLERLETRIMREVENVRSEARDRTEGLESQLAKDVEQLKTRLADERTKRAESLKSLSTDLKAAIKDLEKRLGDLDNVTSKADAELRDQILQNAAAATTQLKQRGDEIRDELDKQAHELRTEKVDTAALVALFSDMALRLTDELPGGEDG